MILTGALAQHVPMHPIIEPANTKMVAKPLTMRKVMAIFSMSLIHEQFFTVNIMATSEVSYEQVMLLQRTSIGDLAQDLD